MPAIAAPAELAAYLERRSAVLARVKTILIDHLQVSRPASEIDPDTPLFGTGLHLDSIDAVELWVNIEVEFGLPPPPEGGLRLTALRTLNTLVDWILIEPRSERDEG